MSNPLQLSVIKTESTPIVDELKHTKESSTRKTASFDGRISRFELKPTIEADHEDDDAEEYVSRTPFSSVPFESEATTDESSTNTDISQSGHSKEVLFTPNEILALRLMFSLFDRWLHSFPARFIRLTFVEQIRKHHNRI